MSWKQGPWWCARCARFGNRFVVVLKCVSTMHDETMRVCFCERIESSLSVQQSRIDM